MMKGNMMILAPLCLLLCWMLPVDSMAIRLNFTLQGESPVYPLDMAEHSVDDMYFDCNGGMKEIIKNKYLDNERDLYLKAWNEARKCAERKQREKQREDEDLTIDHMQAICLYTSNNVYKKFNDEVREQRGIYTSNDFHFHSLHFRLSSAVQILNPKNHCQTVYRRDKVQLTDVVNQTIRFGSFASSSFRTDLKRFGVETCFEIKTCFGAYLKHYPSLGKTEEEVLIPPYEMFNITQKNDRSFKISGLEDCKVVYVLESAGVMSNLNCQIAHPSEFSSSPLARVKNNYYIF